MRHLRPGRAAELRRDFAERLRRAAAALRELRHPNVLAVATGLALAFSALVAEEGGR